MTDDRIEAVRQALAENAAGPGGALRSARAEELVARAEASGDAALLLEALNGQITAYEYSAERGKMMVPFARLLKTWDEQPGLFDQWDAHQLFWKFKWVTGSMLDYPEVPLAAIESWLGEMERRYRLAGYQERTVRVEEFWLAWHVGDLARAERAHAAWVSGTRDLMSNCLACDTVSLGHWDLHHGRDEAALERWRPVLDGRQKCAEEPHRALSYSLVPLLRLGRLDEARANHLRGYRMSRGNESLLPSNARHVEFCALTGNEARGLEILAENVAHLTGAGNPDSVLRLAEAAVLLLDRLAALGLADQPVTGPHGVQPPAGGWTVTTLRAHAEALRGSIAARFDARNGTDAVSRRSLENAVQTPLVDRLPLGVSTVLPRPRAGGAPGAAGSLGDRATVVRAKGVGAVGVPSGDGPEALAALVARAHELGQVGHPEARGAWQAVRTALAAPGAPAPDARLRAELADDEGIVSGEQDAERALAAFARAAQAWREAGDPAQAAVSDGRAAIALALAGRLDDAAGAARAAVAAVQAADPTPRQLGNALLCQAKTLVFTAGQLAEASGAEGAEGAADGGEAAEAVAQEAAEVLAEVERVTAGHPEAAAVAADALQTSAALLSAADDWAPVGSALRAAADAYLAAERPWRAAEVLAGLARGEARYGEPAAAEAAAEEALRHGEGLIDPEQTGLTRLLLADLAAHRGDHQASARHALEASLWLDEAGRGQGPGAAARRRLAHAYQQQGRHAEAAEVLTAALPDLITHGPREEAGARQALADSLLELRDASGAAEQYVLALAIARDWPDQHPHAQLAWSAAEALGSAGQVDESLAAYVAAQELWRKLDEPVPVVRTGRARAWLLARHRQDLAAARELMAEAVEACDAALAQDGLHPGFVELLLHERGQTWRQLGEVVTYFARGADASGADASGEDGEDEREIDAELGAEALRHFARAEAELRELGPERAGAVAGVLLQAAELRIELDQREAAAAALDAVQALHAAHGEPLAQHAARADQMQQWLSRA